MTNGKSKPKHELDYAKLERAVEVHEKALDDLVNVNSLFTAAVFVGLAFANAGQQNIEGDKRCEAGAHVARRLVKNEVISFACYLFSSLVAKSLKTHLFTYLISPHKYDDINDKSSKALRGSLFALSTSTSVIGGVLLLQTMVDMIQLRLGKIACGGAATLHAVGVLIAVNILAWVIYIPFVIYAIAKSSNIFTNIKKDSHGSSEGKAYGGSSQGKADGDSPRTGTNTKIDCHCSSQGKADGGSPRTGTNKTDCHPGPQADAKSPV